MRISEQEYNVDLWQCALANAPAQVKTLVTDGEVPVDERNDLGETALHLAASRGFDDVVELLLSHGANIALQDWESGWTPLHRSVYNAKLSTSLLLLRHARQHLGRQHMKEFLYDTKDFCHQTAMQLVSATSNEQVHNVLRKQFDSEHAYGGDPCDYQAISSSKPRGGMVYTFGKVDFQLGYHLPHVNVQSSPRLVELPISSPIVQIAAGKFHTLALNAEGHVFAWGFGKGGRLGTGSEMDYVEPTRLRAFDDIPLARIAAGENHSLALSCSGQIFSWGSNSFGQLGHSVKTTTHESRLVPKRVDAFKGMVMLDIAASGSHSGAICLQNGFVYTWGSNKRGQLGRKEGFGVDQPNPSPKRVDRLVAGHVLSSLPHDAYDRLRAEHLAMSDVHTCVVLRGRKNGQSHGAVWQFGYGLNVPTRILFKEKASTKKMMVDAWMPRWHQRREDIISVSCAPNHSIALAASGDVYTWGHNGDALSHTVDGVVYQPPGTPQRVELAAYGPIVNVCASQDHCAVVTESGDLLSWGGGPQGVLGHGAGTSWQPRPKQVHGARKVVAVAAGHQHTVLLVAPRLPTRGGGEQQALICSEQEQEHLCSEHDQEPELEQDLEPKPILPKEPRSPPKLRYLLETKIAALLDISNVATVWKYASVHCQRRLQRYCEQYMALNWDALLEMGGKERLDVLFELMLQPRAPLVRAPPPPLVNEQPVKTKPVVRVDKPSRKASVSLEEKKAMPVTQDAVPVPSPPLTPQAASTPPPPAAPVSSGSRKSKATKFVSVDEFFAEKKPDAKPSTNSTAAAPWASAHTVPPSPLGPRPLPTQSPLGPRPMPTPSVQASPLGPRPLPAAPPSAPSAFPSLGESLTRPLPRKESIDKPTPRVATASPKLSFTPVSSPALEPRKQLLGHDGAERLQVSSFSLDAFIKKSSRNKKKRTVPRGWPPVHPPPPPPPGGPRWSPISLWCRAQRQPRV